MTPFEPWASSTLAYQQWRRAIKFAKETDHQANVIFFCIEAMKAQADYMMFSAIDYAKYYRRKGK